MSTATRSADFVAPHGPALLKCDGALELAAVRAPDAAAAVPAAAAASASRFDAGRSARPASAAERFSTGPCVDVAAASIGAAGAAGAVSIGWQLGYLQVQIWRACLQTQTAHLPVPANLMDRAATGIGILYSHLHGRITFTWHLIVAVAYDSIGMLSVKRTSALGTLYQPSSLRNACTGACAILGFEEKRRDPHTVCANDLHSFTQLSHSHTKNKIARRTSNTLITPRTRRKFLGFTHSLHPSRWSMAIYGGVWSFTPHAGREICTWVVARPLWIPRRIE